MDGCSGRMRRLPTFVPLSQLEPATGLDFEPWHSEVHSVSSEGVRRAFCGTCGATVFFWTEERRAVVDTAMGLAKRGRGFGGVLSDVEEREGEVIVGGEV
ncbi:uncharacterized protein PADG_01274 [Paracoccidioides brasiliensis Pb18]|uniref:Uncharacterized protein n=1 Tax=Paracoccidioides brasiliensis (strain Pb18) TaxID=502780 RepID=C1G2V8_PARBD|nr:uncharacterized protein PADG_01274 [Paracoccidioides brasiliensis Pb18]EEH45124.1 hypothetical protein PADG_01274 [Paracoccidioides brasiliensis Pb18]